MRTRRHPRRWLSASILISSAIYISGVEIDSANLKARHTGTEKSKSTTTSGDRRDNSGSGRTVSRTLSLEEIWEAEAVMAQMEADRLLNYHYDFSIPPMPTPPPKPPTPRPPRPTMTPRPTPQGMTRPPFNMPTPGPVTTGPTPKVTQAPTPTPGAPTRSPISTEPTPVQPMTRPPTSTTLSPSAASPAPTPSVTEVPTSPDFCLDGQTRAQYLFEQLSLITSFLTLLDPETPQGQAYEFMLSDPLNPNVCTYPTIDQRYGLATLYYSTNGTDWINSENWLTGTSECEWFGVACTEDGLALNLTLSENNVAGTLPDEISTLYALEKMSFYDNRITSTLPAGFSNMSALCVLDMEMNQLTGTPFSSQILDLPLMKDLLLSNNQFTGTIPDDISRLSNLESFWVASNQLAGTIPASMADMQNLTTVIMYKNSFNSRLEDTPFPNLPLLENLQLWDNVLEGSISAEFYVLTNLEVLRLDNNFIAGTIASDIAQLSLMRDLRLNTNLLNPPLPEELGQLTALEYLVIGSNFFTGAVIPDVFQNLQQLITVDLSLGNFEGPIPSSLFSSLTIQEIYLNNNQLTGPIPSEYAQAPALMDFYLNNNLLTGTVPAILPGQLPNLNEFLIQFNQLTGSMPPSICNLRTSGSLEDLFSDCQGDPPEIECEFPSCCNQCFQNDDTLSLRQRQLFEFMRAMKQNATVSPWPEQKEHLKKFHEQRNDKFQDGRQER